MNDFIGRTLYSVFNSDSCAVLFTVLVIDGITLAIMAFQDYHDCTVSGVLCIVSAVSNCIFAVLSVNSTIIIFIICAMTVVMVVPAEIPIFGDADFVPLIMYLSVFLSRYSSLSLCCVYPLCLLCVLIPYAKWYARSKGKEWYFGCKEMIPAIPAFALAWVMSIASIAFLLVVYRSRV